MISSIHPLFTQVRLSRLKSSDAASRRLESSNLLQDIPKYVTENNKTNISEFLRFMADLTRDTDHIVSDNSYNAVQIFLATLDQKKQNMHQIIMFILTLVNSNNDAQCSAQSANDYAFFIFQKYAEIVGTEVLLDELIDTTMNYPPEMILSSIEFMFSLLQFKTVVPSMFIRKSDMFRDFLYFNNPNLLSAMRELFQLMQSLDMNAAKAIEKNLPFDIKGKLNSHRKRSFVGSQGFATSLNSIPFFKLNPKPRRQSAIEHEKQDFDLDDDGEDEIYLEGAATQQNKLKRNKVAHSFTPMGFTSFSSNYNTFSSDQNDSFLAADQ